MKKDVSFAISDESVSDATSVLLTAGFPARAVYTTCPIANSSFRASPAPSSHVHLDQTTCICLFKKSETFWRVDLSSPPRLRQLRTPSAKRVEVEKEDDRKVDWTSDTLIAYQSNDVSSPSGHGKTCFPPELHLVRVPTVQRLLEAYILLMARDRHKVYKHFCSAMLTYIREYVEGTESMVREELEQWCWDLYDAMFKGHGSVINEMLERVAENGKLGYPLET